MERTGVTSSINSRSNTVSSMTIPVRSVGTWDFSATMVRPVHSHCSQRRLLGSTRPYQYSFQRSTTCSPLLMDDRCIRPYVQHLPDGRQPPGSRYLYGNRTGEFSCTSTDLNCTFELRRPTAEKTAFENTGYTITQDILPNMDHELAADLRGQCHCR